jgi:hypothetical protein
MKQALYRQIASTLRAIKNCEKMGNAEWIERHTARLDSELPNVLPYGGGFDGGSTLLIDESTAQKLVFSTSYHHMSENGYYDGWTEHNVIVTPCLYSGFNLRVTGRDRNQIKDYIGELFHSVLSAEMEWES